VTTKMGARTSRASQPAAPMTGLASLYPHCAIARQCRQLVRQRPKTIGVTSSPPVPNRRVLVADVALYSGRSERQFCERLDYDLLFRFFLDMNSGQPRWRSSPRFQPRFTASARF